MLTRHVQVGRGDDGICQTCARTRGGDGSEKPVWQSPFSSDDAWYGEIMITTSRAAHYQSVLRIKRRNWCRFSVGKRFVCQNPWCARLQLRSARHHYSRRKQQLYLR